MKLEIETVEWFNLLDTVRALKEKVDGLGTPAVLGALASKDKVDYDTDIDNLPTLGNIAAVDFPITDPGTAGDIWLDGGVPKVSQG